MSQRNQLVDTNLLKIQSLTQTVAFFFICGIFFHATNKLVCVCVFGVCVCVCVCTCVCMRVYAHTWSGPTRIYLGAHCIFCAMDLFTLSMTEQEIVTPPNPTVHAYSYEKEIKSRLI